MRAIKLFVFFIEIVDLTLLSRSFLSSSSYLVFISKISCILKSSKYMYSWDTKSDLARKSSWHIWLEKLLVHMVEKAADILYMVEKAADIYGWGTVKQLSQKNTTAEILQLSQQKIQNEHLREIKSYFYLIRVLLCLLEYLLHGPNLLLPRLLPGVHLRLVLRQLEEGGGEIFLFFPYSCLFFKKWAYNFLCSATHQLVVTVVLRWDEM